MIISNQAGVSTGATKIEDLNEINNYIRDDFLRLGLTLLEIYVCTDHWSSESECRKPKPGMFFAAANDHRFRLDRVIYVGDDERDALASINAGCNCLLVSSEKLQDQLDPNVDLVGRNLSDLVPDILRQYEIWENSNV